jgi:hypothetical protein
MARKAAKNLPDKTAPPPVCLPIWNATAAVWIGGQLPGRGGKKIYRQASNWWLLSSLSEHPASDLFPKTIQRHVDNIRTLGGEIVLELNENSSPKTERHRADSC